MEKKIFIVALIQKTIQEKLVEAESKEQAIQIAHETDWHGKDEVLDSDLKAKTAKFKQHFYEGSYIETGTDDGSYRYKKQK